MPLGAERRTEQGGQGGGMSDSQKTDLTQVKASRRTAIDPALSETALTSLSTLNRRVRTRLLGGVGAGEGDLPGHPIGLRAHKSDTTRALSR